MAGEVSFSEDEVASVRDVVMATMQEYVRLAGASAPANVRAAYSRQRQGWFLDLQEQSVRAVNDPFARDLVARAP